MKLLLLGATGLVGRSVLDLALADSRVASVVALTRRTLLPHVKLTNVLVDFDALEDTAPWWAVDSVICALGTTMKTAGSREAFRKVDYEYPLVVARRARKAGARAFVLNSSVGANASSRTFYLKTKGEAEAAVSGLGYPSVTLVRPAGLMGERKEFRLAERVMTPVLETLRALVPRRYRMVPADRVAACLLEEAIAARPGTQVVESEQI